MPGMPRLRFNLELDAIKMSVARAISELQIADYVKEGAEKAVDAFDFDAEVKKVVDEELKMQIKDYFHYGNGKKAIEQAIKESFKTSTKEE